MTIENDAKPTEDEASAATRRVSTIVGDRLCVGCGFNLTGQPIVKEPTYGLLIARCPECGVVAALQEYPLLGKWANRWASLAAALWLLVLLGGAFGFGMMVFGLSMATVEVGSDHFADAIVLASPVSASSGASNAGGGFGGNINRWNSIIELSWWRAQNPWAILEQAGGFRRRVASDVVGFWMGLFIAGSVAGVAGSVALLHARRRRAVVLALLPVAIAATVQTVVQSSLASEVAHSMTASASTLARVTLGPALFALADAAAYLGLAAGVVAGRSIVRGLARALLPPRMRSSLAFLWLADDKPPPTP
ncbi:MAG: hypothetical protein D6693_02145 [Planctomycetota bacterium]|nr:MAG: hypothetical protein D6693_02145 [Planctomycetota bacterium]